METHDLGTFRDISQKRHFLQENHQVLNINGDIFPP